MKTCPTCQATYPDDSKVCPKDGFVLQSSTELSPGTVLRGKYKILSKIGEGGMGAVYKACHVHFDEIWALKVVSPDLGADKEFLARFRSEAMLMRRLNHPNAVHVEDFDVAEDGSSFMVMEFVDGINLEQLLAEGGPLDPVRVAQIGMQVCGALGAAHALGVIHRDVKPANILIATAADGSEVAKVMDFGVAKVKETSGLKSAAMTAVGFVVGTPTYMSPEQVMGLRGDKLDGRSDLYALGVVLYELLTGRTPFVSKNAMALLTAHMQTKPPDPRTFRHDLPPQLVAAVLKALEKDPADRFSSAEAMSEALREFLKSAGALHQKPATGSRAVRPAAIPLAAPVARTEPHVTVPVPESAAAPREAPRVAPVVSAPRIDTVRTPGPTPPVTLPPASNVSAARPRTTPQGEKRRRKQVPLGEIMVRWVVILIVVAAVVTTAYFMWSEFFRISPAP